MFGIGIDIVKISRIECWLNDSEILGTVYTYAERNYCLMMRNSHRQLASIFAAKEAFMKAIGTGWGNGLSWKDIEVFHNRNGLYSINLYNRAKELYGRKSVCVSMSYTDDLAIATVLIQD